MMFGIIMFCVGLVVGIGVSCWILDDSRPIDLPSQQDRCFMCQHMDGDTDCFCSCHAGRFERAPAPSSHCQDCYEPRVAPGMMTCRCDCHVA